jgi:hypothetical protein
MATIQAPLPRSSSQASARPGQAAMVDVNVFHITQDRIAIGRRQEAM